MLIFLTVAKYELVQSFRTKSNYVVLFALPLLLIFILGSALSTIFTTNDVEVERVELAIVVVDQGVMREPINQFLDSPDIAPYIIARHVAAREDVVSDIRAGKADYGLVVPSDFSEKM